MTGFLFLLALTSLSTSPLFVRWSEAPTEFLGFWRLLTAGLLLLAVLIFKRAPRPWTGRPLKDWFWPLASGVFFFLHLWTYVVSAKTTSIAHMTILFATNPIFTVGGAALFFGERLKKRWIIAYPLAFAGLWILAREKVSFAPQSQWGDFLAVVSAALHAAYLLSSKRARRTLDNLTFSTVLYLSAGILFAALALLQPQGLDHLSSTSETAWPAVAGLILLPTFLGHALMTYLVNRMDLSFLSCGKLLEPALSSLFAFWFFAEPVGPATLTAFACTGFSIFILFWPWGRKETV